MKKTIFVTGGARGIGREVVKQLYDGGSNVFFTYNHSSEEAKMLHDELAGNTGRDNWIKYSQCDLADMKSVRKMISENKDVFTQTDVIVNNAGMISQIPQFLIMADMDNWWKVLQNNIACVVNPVRAIAPFMIRKKKRNHY
jgi:3-oxoacyl-[acyl-carrier protein] reductase